MSTIISCTARNQFLRNCARIFFYLIAARNRVQELGGSRDVFDPNVIKKRKSYAALRGVQARTRRIRGQKGARIRRVDGHVRDWHTRVCNLHA